MKAKIPLCRALRTSSGSTKRGKGGEREKRKQVSKGKREGWRGENTQVQHGFNKEIPVTRTVQKKSKTGRYVTDQERKCRIKQA